MCSNDAVLSNGKRTPTTNVANSSTSPTRGPRAAATAQRMLTDPPPALTALNADDIAALTRIFANLNAKSEPLATDH